MAAIEYLDLDAEDALLGQAFLVCDQLFEKPAREFLKGDIGQGQNHDIGFQHTERVLLEVDLPMGVCLMDQQEGRAARDQKTEIQLSAEREQGVMVLPEINGKSVATGI